MFKENIHVHTRDNKLDINVIHFIIKTPELAYPKNSTWETTTVIARMLPGFKYFRNFYGISDTFDYWHVETSCCLTMDRNNHKLFGSSQTNKVKNVTKLVIQFGLENS